MSEPPRKYMRSLKDEAQKKARGQGRSKVVKLSDARCARHTSPTSSSLLACVDFPSEELVQSADRA